MKKRVLSVLLVIALLVAVGIVAAQAEETYTPDQIVELSADQTFALAEGAEYVEQICYACGKTVQWYPLHALTDTTTNYTGITGHYFLADETLESSNGNGVIYANAAGTLCLHLNGKTIANSNNLPAIRTWSGPFNLMGTGTVKGGNFGWGGLHCGGPNTKVYGGTYETYSGSANDYAITFGGGTTNIYAAEVTEGKGAVRVCNWYATSQTRATIHGGTYPNNVKCDNYQGPVLELTVKGGTFNSIAAINDLTIEGGSVNTLTATAGTVTLSGAPTVGALNLTSGLTVDATGLTEGASIGLGTTEGVFTTAFGSEAAAEAVKEYFKNVDGKAIFVNEDWTLSHRAHTPDEVVTLSKAQDFGSEAVAVEKYCYACNKMATWQPLTAVSTVYGGAMADDGHYFLANDIINYATDATAGTTSIGSCLYFNKQVGTRDDHIYCIHLNGKKIEQQAGGGLTAIQLWTNRQTVNIMGDGIVTGKTGGARGILNMDAAAAVNIYGGTYSALDSDKNAIANRNADAIVNVYGGEIGTGSTFNTTGGVTTIAGGTFSFGDFRGGTVAVTGGSITTLRVLNTSTANVTISGGNVTTLNAAAATVTLQGGNVATANISGTAVATLSGAPTVGALNLASGLTVDATGLTEGASVGVGTTSGTFTSAFADEDAAKAAAAYFVPSEKVAVAENALTCNAYTFTNDEIIAKAKAQKFGTEATVTWCYKCNKAVTWEPMTEAPGALSSGGHYFLANEITSSNSTGAIYMSGSGTLCLHLNNKTIRQTGATWPAIRMWSSNYGLNLMGDGVVSSNAKNWGALSCQGGTANIYGGEYINDGSNYKAAIMCRSATINIYDATIEAGNGNLRFSNYNNTSYPTVNVYGGDFATTNGVEPNATVTIQGGNFGTFYAGGPITVNGGTFETLQASSPLDLTNVAGDLTIQGGTIDKLVATQYTNSIAVVGAPTVGTTVLHRATEATDEAEATEDKVLDLTGLTGGSIGIGSTDGVLTTAFETAEAAAEAAKFVTSATKAISVDEETKVLVAADGTVAVVNGEDQKAYATYADAEEAYTKGYIKLLADTVEIDLNKDVTIDLNGQQMVNVSGNGTLTGLDSATYQNYTAVPGSIVIAEDATVTVLGQTLEPENGITKGYLPVTTDDETTFTYYEMKLSGVALKANPEEVGMYYKGMWSFNDYLDVEGVSELVEAGVVVSLYDMPGKDFLEENTAAETTVNYDFGRNPANITDGEAMTSVLVDGIMQANRAEDKIPEGYTAEQVNMAYGQVEVYACTYIMVNGEVVALSEGKDLSICELLKLFELEENAAVYEVNKDKLNNFYATWVDLALLDDETWGLTKIGQTVES